MSESGRQRGPRRDDAVPPPRRGTKGNTDTEGVWVVLAAVPSLQPEGAAPHTFIRPPGGGGRSIGADGSGPGCRGDAALQLWQRENERRASTALACHCLCYGYILDIPAGDGGSVGGTLHAEVRASHRQRRLAQRDRGEDGTETKSEETEEEEKEWLITPPR